MLEWKREFSVDNYEIDQQHKKLFEIGNELYDLIKAKRVDAYDDIIKVLNQLQEYTIKHFEFEEGLMAHFGYTDLENHKKEHAAFIKKLDDMKKKDIDEAQKMVMMDLVVFISDWITTHILKKDHEYMECFSKAIQS